MAPPAERHEAQEQREAHICWAQYKSFSEVSGLRWVVSSWQVLVSELPLRHDSKDIFARLQDAPATAGGVFQSDDQTDFFFFKYTGYNNNNGFPGEL